MELKTTVRFPIDTNCFGEIIQGFLEEYDSVSIKNDGDNFIIVLEEADAANGIPLTCRCGGRFVPMQSGITADRGICTKCGSIR